MTVTLPYIKGTTDKISYIIKKHNIKTAFNTANKIKHILNTAKDQVKNEEQGVYMIP